MKEQVFFFVELATIFLLPQIILLIVCSFHGKLLSFVWLDNTVQSLPFILFSSRRLPTVLSFIIQECRGKLKLEGSMTAGTIQLLCYIFAHSTDLDTGQP